MVVFVGVKGLFGCGHLFENKIRYMRSVSLLSTDWRLLYNF